MRIAVAAVLLLAASGLQAKSQAELCAPNDGEGDMRCVDRNGHCVGLLVDGQATVAFADGADAARVMAFSARRIVFRRKVDDQVERGERVGLIKFGSRVDVFLPRGFAVKVRVGDRVSGGLSVLAKAQ